MNYLLIQGKKNPESKILKITLLEKDPTDSGQIVNSLYPESWSIDQNRLVIELEFIHFLLIMQNFSVHKYEKKNLNFCFNKATLLFSLR